MPPDASTSSMAERMSVRITVGIWSTLFTWWAARDRIWSCSPRRREASCARLRAVMSARMTTTVSASSAPSGATHIDTSTVEPSLRRRWVSNPGATSPSIWARSVRANSPRSVSFPGGYGWPTTSSAPKPRMRSAAGLHSRTRRAPSRMTMARGEAWISAWSVRFVVTTSCDCRSMVSRAPSSACARSLISRRGEGGISKRRWPASTAGAAEESAPIDPAMRAPTRVAMPTASRVARIPPVPTAQSERRSAASNVDAGSASETVQPVNFERENAK